MSLNTKYNITQLVKFANYLADRAAEISMHHFRNHNLYYNNKEDKSPVTIADKEIEELLRLEITKKFPDHGIVGEELQAKDAKSGYEWIIDPIDGTISFCLGKPIFGCLIALVFEKKPVIGIMDIPALKERWVSDGNETFFNNKKVTTSKKKSLYGVSLCSSSADCYFTKEERAKLSKVADYANFQNCGGVVRGSDCYIYGLLANGFVDLIMDVSLKIHDFAALIPIITGSGGVIKNWQGEDLLIEEGSKQNVIAACNAEIMNLALQTIK